AGQPQVVYGWDNANRLTGITQGSSAVGINYDNANRRTSLTLPNGVTVGYGFDNDSRITGLTYSAGGSQLGNLTYGYDADGRVTSKNGTLAAIGLPTSVSGNTFNADNGMTGFGGATLSYDANGNLTSDGTNNYTWDARNHLTAITGAVAASFTYDAFGRRVSKTIAGTSTQFLYDILNPVQEIQAGAPSANLLTGGRFDEYFTRTDSSNNVSTLLQDALGSIIGLVGSGQSIATSYTYQPFGATTVGGAANGNSYQFTGRENDSTGLYYYRARYYSPNLQRFVSQDPIGFRGGDPNLYAYVLSDPVLFRDPSGTLLVGIGVGLVVGGVEGAIGAELQGGSTSQIITSALIGAAAGAALGAIDPTEGALTVGGIAGVLGDLTGQLIPQLGRPCKSLNLGELAGAGLGGAAGGFIGAETAGAFAGLGASELVQALAAAGLSAAPSTLGGPIGAPLGPIIQLP